MTWDAAILTVCAVVVVALAVYWMRRVARPLRMLTAALRRLADGDYSARAPVTGPAAVREAGRLLNVIAGEVEGLRRGEQEHARLRTVVEQAGNRIRASLSEDAVIREAVATVEESLDSDVAYLHLMKDGRIGPPVGHELDWLMPIEFTSEMEGVVLVYFRGLLRNHSSMVVQDLTGKDAEFIPPRMRDPLIRAGVVSEVLTPFGDGDEMTGFAVAARTRRGHPWTEAEIKAFESIASDIGTGLHHARLYEAEKRLANDLKALDRARTDFLATLSHELGTPLTSILGYAEQLEDGDGGPVTPEQQKMIGTIHRNAALLRSLIGDVLLLTRMDLGVSKRKEETVDLAETAEAAVTAIQPIAGTARVAVSADYADGHMPVTGDSSQLDRVLTNLLSNAVKFTPAGGHVTLTLARDGGGKALLRVRDSGIGIPEKDMNQLFSRFFRASNARARSVPGTGLGLAISRMIIEEHGGQIDLQSAEGAGTTVTIRLPLAGPG